MALPNVPEGDGEEEKREEEKDNGPTPTLHPLPPLRAATAKLEPLGGVPAVKAPPSTAVGAPEFGATTQATARLRLKMQLARKESWMPLVQRVVMQGGYATNAIWGCDRENFIAVGGANGMILLRDYPSMNLLNGFICESAVNAVGGSRDGSLLAYGLRNGNVELRDVRFLRSSHDKTIEHVQTLSHDGKVCAIWVSPDIQHIVVAWYYPPHIFP